MTMGGRLDNQIPRGGDQTPKGTANVWATGSTAVRRQSPGMVGRRSRRPASLPTSESGSDRFWLVLMLVALMVLLLSFARWDGPGGASSVRPCQPVGLSVPGNA
jgi:hypothetical protein